MQNRAELIAMGVRMAMDVVQQQRDNICGGGDAIARQTEEAIAGPYLDGVWDELHYLAESLKKGRGMAELITIKTADGDWEENVITHLPSVDGQGDYATLCGLALDGDEDSGTMVSAPKKRVTCATCRAMWMLCRSFKSKTFWPED